MKILLYISRIFVGALFIVSGLIKANDTLGFSYKLEEYFENGALAYRIRDWFGWDSFSLEFLMEHALMLAVIMCATEIILGFAVLFGTKIKFATISLLALTTMFFFLTLHTATCDPHGSYDEVSAVAMGSDEYARMLNRMENNSKLIIVDEDASERTIIFKEEMPVQCVTDCGCFGDAMKGSLGRSLSPWESWTKDLVLMIFIIPIFLARKKIKVNTTKEDVVIFIGAFVFTAFLSWVFAWYFPLVFLAIGIGGYYTSKRFLFNIYLKWIPILLVTIATLVLIYYTINHLPLRDYRAYAVGNSIPEQMVLPEGAVPDVYENIFYYKNKTSGKVEEFTESTYPWDDDNYEFSDRETKLISEGDKAEITDFTITAEDGNDYSADYFNEEGYIFMFVCYDITKAELGSIKKINTFVTAAGNDANYSIGLTASLYTDVEKFKHENQLALDFYGCDAITLKTIVRANPGVVLMKKGKILGKWNANDLPDYDVVKNELLK
ncbi:MAG: DoxX family membrane protein [Vicingaceae bacterium]|nr:DoxX family membrane protein [Vicingaceae bacterium]